MGRYTGPKERLSRREGVNLFLKGARSFSPKNGLTKKPYPPGQHADKLKSRLSGYGIQLREKQKVKRIYGVRERQFKNVYTEATRRAKVYNTDRGLELLTILETRLDNVIYILGLASSRAAARQAVVHGHVKLNGSKMTVPSHSVKVGDTVEIVLEKLVPVEVLVQTPAWVEKTGMSGKIARLPLREEIDEGIRENLIIEFYSR